VNRILFQALVALFVATQAAAQSGDASQELTRLEDAWALAVQSGDVEALRLIIADDYIGTTAGGAIQHKEAYLADFISGDRNTSLLTTEDLRVQIYGSTAVLTHGGRAESELRGEKIAGSFRWTHVFVERDGRWQAVANHVTSVPGG